MVKRRGFKSAWPHPLKNTAWRSAAEDAHLRATTISCFFPEFCPEACCCIAADCVWRWDIALYCGLGGKP
jgi:hypothetical protein